MRLWALIRSSVNTPSAHSSHQGWPQGCGEQKTKVLEYPAMAVRSCRVTITDTEGVSHTVGVTASTLYEAVALGLKAIRSHNWVEGISEQFGTVRVSVTDIPVEHTVKLRDFTSWLERTAGSPKDVTARSRVREILR